jgi:hypothetical protein
MIRYVPISDQPSVTFLTTMLVYPRAELLALRKLPHVSERGSDEGADEVLPKGMPQRGEGIG